MIWMYEKSKKKTRFDLCQKLTDLTFPYCGIDQSFRERFGATQ